MVWVLEARYKNEQIKSVKKMHAEEQNYVLMTKLKILMNMELPTSGEFRRQTSIFASH